MGALMAVMDQDWLQGERHSGIGEGDGWVWRRCYVAFQRPNYWGDIKNMQN